MFDFPKEDCLDTLKDQSMKPHVNRSTMLNLTLRVFLELKFIHSAL